MKKIILSLSILTSSLTLFAATPLEIKEKVLKAFNKTFEHAQDVSWSEYLPYYEVNFRQNDIKTKITYKDDGTIVKTIRYYYGDQLPLLLLTKVKNTFTDKKIFGVVEESNDEGVIYHITLEDAKNWILINADNAGTLTTENKYKKA